MGTIQLIGEMRCYSNKEKTKEIILFPDIPYWFIASAGSSDILKKVNKKDKNFLTSLNDIEQDFVRLMLEEGILVEGEHLKENNENYETTVYPLQGVWLNIESGCNINCKHCFLGTKVKNSDQLTPKEIHKLCREIVKVSGKHGVKVDVTGGEPLLRKDIIDIFNAMRIDGIIPNFITNGMLLNEHVVNYLAKNKIETTISLDGINQKQHEFIRGKGTYSQTLKAIKMCVEKKVPLTLSLTVHQGNQESVLDYFKMAEELGAEKVILNFLNDFGNAECNGLGLPNEYKIIKELLNRATMEDFVFQKLVNTAISKLIETVLLPIRTDCCGSGINTCSITSDGGVYPCPSFQIEQYKAGNIRNTPFDEIWNDINTFKEHRAININTLNSVCAKCDFRLFCGGGCRAQAYYTNEKNLYARSKKCKEYKQTYLEIMWLLEQHPILRKLRTSESTDIYE